MRSCTRNRLSGFAAIAALVTVSGGAMVVSQDSRRSSQDGADEGADQGLLITCDGQSNFVSADLKLLSDSSNFAVVFTKRNGTEVEFRGQWLDGGTHRFFKLNEGMGSEELKGYGEFTLAGRDKALKTFEAAGSMGHRPFVIEYGPGVHERHEEIVDEEERRNQFSFADDGIVGAGRLMVGSSSSFITRLSIDMSRGGDLTIIANGPGMAETTWQGRWDGNGPVYQVELRDGRNLFSNAEGTIRLNEGNNELVSLDIKGTERGRRFELEFVAEY